MSELVGVLEQLKRERARAATELRQLDQAIRALSSISVRVGKQGGSIPTRRPMSAAARRRIAAAQKARWAKFRASKRKAA
jgi:hypothetical protein